MKIILTVLLTMSISMSLNARMNPFEATNTFNEKKAEYLKEERKKKAKEIMLLENARLAEKEKVEKRKQEKKIAQAKKIEKEKEEKRLAEQKKLKMVALEKKKLAKIAARNQTFDLLSFVDIKVVNDVLVINVDKKYKLSNQDILKEQKKFIFDFRGKVSFYSIRRMIKSENFKSLAIGTHRKSNFFRVVIDLSDDTKNYKKTVNTQKGIITLGHL